MADRLKISKGDILNPESGEDAAVKLALAETHVIGETKKYLEDVRCDLIICLFPSPPTPTPN